MDQAGLNAGNRNYFGNLSRMRFNTGNTGAKNLPKGWRSKMHVVDLGLCVSSRSLPGMTQQMENVWCH